MNKAWGVLVLTVIHLILVLGLRFGSKHLR
jgi:hypothetical protein